MKKFAMVKMIILLCIFLQVMTTTVSAERKFGKRLRWQKQDDSLILPGDHSSSIFVEGYSRSYFYYLPKDFSRSNDQLYPVIIVLHGTFGTGEHMAKHIDILPLADRDNIIIVAPDGIGREWADGSGASNPDKKGINDVRFISELIDHLIKTLPVDSHRVYVTGMSNGGIFSHTLGCRLPEKIAAIAPVSQELAINVAKGCSHSIAMPVLTIHGDADPTVPYKGGRTKKGSMILGAKETALFWAKKNGCNLTASTEKLPDKSDDGTSLSVDIYSGCRDDADVKLYTIHNGGHCWPGVKQFFPERRVGKTNYDINASEVIWEFFKEHPKRGN